MLHEALEFAQFYDRLLSSLFFIPTAICGIGNEWNFFVTWIIISKFPIWYILNDVLIDYHLRLYSWQFIRCIPWYSATVIGTFCVSDIRLFREMTVEHLFLIQEHIDIWQVEENLYKRLPVYATSRKKRLSILIFCDILWRPIF